MHVDLQVDKPQIQRKSQVKGNWQYRGFVLLWPSGIYSWYRLRVVRDFGILHSIDIASCEIEFNIALMLVMVTKHAGKCKITVPCYLFTKLHRSALIHRQRNTAQLKEENVLKFGCGRAQNVGEAPQVPLWLYTVA
jgi:hypothetical protein